MWPYYQDGFLYFEPGLGVKLSLIFLLLAVAILFWNYEAGNKRTHRTGMKQCSVKTLNLLPGDRIRLTVTATFYILLLVTGIPQGFPLHALDFLWHLARGYLEIEPLLSITVCTAAIGAGLIRGSNREYLNAVNFTVRALFFVSVFAMLLTRQIPVNGYNLAWFAWIGASLTILQYFSLQKLQYVYDSEDMFFAPVENYELLFPCRRGQANELIRIMEGDFTGGISVCVSGKWGIGKTSLVLGSCNELHKKWKDSYAFIFIQALELDTLSSLFNYFFTRVKSILKSRGAYVGIGSEYQKLISSLGGLISNASLTSFLERNLFPPPLEDYRSQREQLESLISEVFTEGKLIIVVDDIERCEPNKAKEFLFFIKEIATMRCCISIFIADYQHLPEYNGSDANLDFYDKFFNYRINVTPVPQLDMLKYWEKGGEKAVEAVLIYPQFMYPSHIYQKIVQKFEDHLEKERKRKASFQSYKDNQEELEKCEELLNAWKSKFEHSFDRPRTVIKFYRTYFGYCSMLCERYGREQREELTEYFTTIQLSDLLFFLSYLQVCFPTEYELFQKENVDGYLKLPTQEHRENQKFLLELWNRILFEEKSVSTSFPQTQFSYKCRKRITFLQTLISDPKELTNIVNGFTSYQREWLYAVEHDDAKAMGEHWNDMILTVLKSMGYWSERNAKKQPDWENLLERLLRFGKKNVVEGVWPAEKVFRIFDRTQLDQRLMVTYYAVVPFVSSFTETFGEDEIVKALPESSIKMLDSYSMELLYQYCLPINTVLDYGMEPGRSRPLQTASEIFFVNRPSIENMSLYLARIRELGIWKERLPERFPPPDPLEGFEIMVNCAEAFLKEKNLLVYPDVKGELKLMKLAVYEMKAFYSLLQKVKAVHDKGKKIDFSSLLPEQYPYAVADLEQRFQQKSAGLDQQLQQDFRYFFQCAIDRPEASNSFSAEDVRRLSAIVDAYASLKQESVHYFRKSLMLLLEKIKSSSNKERTSL